MNDSEKLLCLAQQAEIFLAFYRTHNARCVDASAEFLKVISKELKDDMQTVVRTIRLTRDGKNRKYEHSWFEIKIGKTWYVVDITGVRQFRLWKTVWKRAEYMQSINEW